MSNTKFPIIRVDKSLDEYLTEMSMKTRLSKVKCSELLGKKLRNGKKRKVGFRFDFKI